jgi:putative hydrolase of the HAD superfamily
MKCIAPAIRAVFFDAVGTLLHPDPPAAEVYAIVGARFGSRLGSAVIVERFGAAFQRQEDIDRAAGYVTSEAREVARWRSIVAEVLDDVVDGDGCFRALYDHFARPDAWRVDSDAPATLEALAQRGCLLGVCSNFDHRLRGLLTALPQLARARRVIISSEVGCKKPAARFFAEVARAAVASPEQILLVGDDEENDFAGARAAGLEARLLDPNGQSALAPEWRITRLRDLID